MRIDRVSIIVGRGTLLEGRVAHGTLQEGGSVEILGPQNVVLNPTILGIFISNTQTGQVTVGDYGGVLVQSTETSAVSPGMLLVESGEYESYEEALQGLQ
jgi:translation elongation factor EF-Tu-like GTPase